MFCKHCNKKIPDYARFCIYCGEAVEPVAPAPNSAAETTPVSAASVSPDAPESIPNFFHQPAALSPLENTAPETEPDTLEDIPDILPPESLPLEELYVSESRAQLNQAPVGSYQEIMEEFSHLSADAADSPEAKKDSAPPRKPPQTGKERILSLLGSRKRIFLISGLTLGLCLVAVIAFLLLLSLIHI